MNELYRHSNDDLLFQQEVTELEFKFCKLDKAKRYLHEVVTSPENLL
jgi:hypothetical protein